MEEYLVELMLAGAICLLLVPMITIVFNLVLNHYTFKVISINIELKNYATDFDVIKKAKVGKNKYLEKIRKLCNYKFLLKFLIGFIGISFTVIYLYKQIIQIELFGNINPLNELIEVLKANQFEPDKLVKIQDKINAISYQEKPTLGLYILGQVLLASFALNDICGNGKFPSDEFGVRP